MGDAVQRLAACDATVTSRRANVETVEYEHFAGAPAVRRLRSVQLARLASHRLRTIGKDVLAKNNSPPPSAAMIGLGLKQAV
jgi:hypothetical protein